MHTKRIRQLALAFFALVGLSVLINGGQIQKSGSGFSPMIPKTWDDAALATLEVPLANTVGSPKHDSADYYYRIPVRPIYKSYPVYAPGHEPPGYMEWLKQQEPVIVWDDGDHSPPLRTEEDWINAGEIVFDSPIGFGRPGRGGTSVAEVRDPTWYEKTGTPVAKDGAMRIATYVICQKGVVEVVSGGCATCHTRLMPDGSVVKGAQGNISAPHMFAHTVRRNAGAGNEADQALAGFRAFLKGFYAMPWLHPDPAAALEQMSADEIASRWENFPPGVNPRHRSSYLHPTQVPDLIGVRDRKYLDRTGLQQHRSIVDMMRYAALNQGVDNLASFAGFIANGGPGFDKLPSPTTLTRYSDEQLYALALYIYSLQPPPNPNKFDALAERGQKMFQREGCAMCHTPPLYTNNKLTPAEGFTVPEDHLKKYDILPISVGTDPNLTLKTKRGTGYYKVPSLKGVWYRGMFGHSGWCATLEDWFDPRRTRDDYVPTGCKPYDVKTYAVKGHTFGLNLSVEDRKALIAFLKTL
jgi:hypothetical protein